MKKRVKHNLMRAGLGALALAALVALDVGQMNQARADVRVQARIQLPNVGIQFRTAPDHRRVVRRAHRPFVYRITAEDRAIARRLARRTGQRTIVLLDLRSRGLSWTEIGYRLDIPRGWVRLAVRGGGPVHARGHGHHGHHGGHGGHGCRR